MVSKTGFYHGQVSFILKKIAGMERMRGTRDREEWPKERERHR